jgi:hypothetical protein
MRERPIVLLWSEDKSLSSIDHASHNNDNETSISKATDMRCDEAEVRDDRRFFICRRNSTEMYCFYILSFVEIRNSRLVDSCWLSSVFFTRKDYGWRTDFMRIQV